MYLGTSVQNAPIEPEFTDAQLSRMFTMFKSVFMAGMQLGEGRAVDVEAALPKLENTVLQISDGVATGKSFQKPSGFSIDSDDDFTTPSNKVKIYCYITGRHGSRNRNETSSSGTGSFKQRGEQNQG